MNFCKNIRAQNHVNVLLNQTEVAELYDTVSTSC